MPTSPKSKPFSSDPAYSSYVQKVFLHDDPILVEIRERADREGLPHIHVSPFDVLHLEVIARATGAKKIVEIGTLAGYSGVGFARALPEDGVLHTFEFSPKHAQVARESFRKAGVEKKVTVHVGAAVDNLPKIENLGPFDLVFIDADKPSYPAYLKWATKNLRSGGVVLVDNSFAWGLVLKDENDPSIEAERKISRAAIIATNAALADPKGAFRATMIPTSEGLTMAVKK